MDGFYCQYVFGGAFQTKSLFLPQEKQENGRRGKKRKTTIKRERMILRIDG